MPDPIPISGLRVYRLAIPMRQKFKHAVAERSVADPLIVEIELANHVLGYGEIHPRPYVTGETHESAMRDLEQVFLPLLLETRPAVFGEAIEAAANLPLTDDGGRVICATRCGVELAVLDAYSRAFNRSIEHVAGYIDESLLGSSGSRQTARYSGVLSSDEPSRAARSVRKMRLFGLRHFKLKVGDAGDEDRLQAIVRVLKRKLDKGSCTLRLDANGAWTPAEALARMNEWESLPIVCVEQPLAKGNVEAWAGLARQTNLPLMADESLVTPQDAQALVESSAASWFNIRIGKNGGLIPAMRLALWAARHGVECQMGCMVGETSILSAAGQWFLAMMPNIRIAEGSFGKFLLEGDVVRRPWRFKFGGRWSAPKGPGLGPQVRPELLTRWSAEKPVFWPL